MTSGTNEDTDTDTVNRPWLTCGVGIIGPASLPADIGHEGPTTAYGGR